MRIKTFPLKDAKYHMEKHTIFFSLNMLILFSKKSHLKFVIN